MAIHKRDIENENTGLWRAYRQAQQARRHIRLPQRTAEIEALRSCNFRVRRLTDFQFRVDERLDLYPIHRRYHDVKTGKRGTYQNPKDIATRILRKQVGE